MNPCLLALDTATDVLALALVTPQGRWCATETGGARASARLLPRVRELLDDAGLAMGALQGVAFGRGPGAFTGLRTACAVAQGLGFGLGVPLLAIDSLMIVAEDARVQAFPSSDAELWVAMDARMDEVYAAAYRHGTEGWTASVPPALYTLPALAARWAEAPPGRVAGSAVSAFAGRLPLGGASTVATEHDRAAALLRLAEAAWAGAANRLDAAEALPLYLRDKVALTTAERASARGQAADARARAAAAG